LAGFEEAILLADQIAFLISITSFLALALAQHPQGLYSLSAVNRQMPYVGTAVQRGKQPEKRLIYWESIPFSDRNGSVKGARLDGK